MKEDAKCAHKVYISVGARVRRRGENALGLLGDAQLLRNNKTNVA